jgi:hypothetical protein
MQFVLEGAAVVLGVDGISDLAAMYSRKQCSRHGCLVQAVVNQSTIPELTRSRIESAAIIIDTPTSTRSGWLL